MSSDPNSWSEMKATLILDDGSSFTGKAFGSSKSLAGELVFQTGMVGYVESLTDPSYHSQLLVVTYPLVGNYGVPPSNVGSNGISDFFESNQIWAAALIVDSLCDTSQHSHWNAVESLHSWLLRSGVPGIYGLDTRLLTKRIRASGSMNAKIIMEGDSDTLIPYVDINSMNLVAQVSVKQEKLFLPPKWSKEDGGLNIIAVDCGLKFNQLRCFLDRGVAVRLVPWNYSFEKDSDFDGLFLSNGPGDPEVCAVTVEHLTNLINSYQANPATMKPIFGICLGNQLLGRSAGASTYKLKYGNRGHNQPCVHLDTGRCFITSQNHGFAIDAGKLNDGWSALFSNKNDGSNEGIVHDLLPYFSVQFHPEHMGGPMDMECLFDVFIEAMYQYKLANRINIRQLITSTLQYVARPGLDPSYISENKIPNKVMILGSGGLTIGQAGEFDYSGSQALKALKEEDVRTVLINPNIATVQTSKGFADKTIFIPVNAEYVEQAIKQERPDGILLTFGGQTGLNCGIDLEPVLEKYGVQVMGTPLASIKWTEDRAVFAQKMAEIGEEVAPNQAAVSVAEALEAAGNLGYPVLVRSAYALGGLGSGFASDAEELKHIAQVALANSSQVLIDKDLRGWKELEYEVVRDAYDNCISVCNMENLDPVGIHTGESIVIAPSQTLSNYEYNMLRTCALKVIRHLGVVGECNIQYALDPHSTKYYIIEVNARLSRSSALASKATGYPLAYIAAKLALGKSLPDLQNSVTGSTTACFEPSLDYCVVKMPRWDLGKFSRVSTQIGTSMKSVGEVMGIGRCFEEAFQKALRMVNETVVGFDPFEKAYTEDEIVNATDKRMFVLAAALYQGHTVDELHDLTKIDRLFLFKLYNIIQCHKLVEQFKDRLSDIDYESLLYAKKLGFADRQIARITETNELAVRRLRKHLEIVPFVKQIDTVAAEWPAQTNYLYLTYSGQEHDLPNASNAVMVLGSGVYRIGSSVEFDCCSVGAINELSRMGKQTIMVNCNPETVSTDYDMCDRLYFEEISFEVTMDIHDHECPESVIVSMGGQLPNNIAVNLSRQGVKISGTSAECIDKAENRFKFSRLLDTIGVSQPRWKNAANMDEAKAFCDDVGYPCLIRPSYVLSGAAMNVAHSHNDLENYLMQASIVSKDHPVVVSKFILDAKEIDVDAVAAEGEVLRLAICEHVENAGVHSGDATLVTPPQDLTAKTTQKIKDIVYKIARHLQVNGPMNLQLIAKDDQLKVIECNLRVSRSFPFVSKALGCDMIADATRVMLGEQLEPRDITEGCGKVGVKVPVFSFARLTGADVVLGVEMASTGEVACFGENRYEAYLKALMSTNFKLPQKAVMVSIGSHKARMDLLSSVQALQALGMTLYGSYGTADFYRESGVKMTAVDWPFESTAATPKNSSNTKVYVDEDIKSIADYVQNKEFDLIINIPMRGRGAYRVSSFITRGYTTRRMAVDNGIPLMTDVKCAKLLVEAMRLLKGSPPLRATTDCLTSQNLVRLPGLIDIHVHTRHPGATYKEDWTTCTQAALAGGITMVLAMPNTNPPLTNLHSLTLIEEEAAGLACCDYGLYIGATEDNADRTAKLASKAVGLKMYLNETFNTLRLPKLTSWMDHFQHCPREFPIVCHAEGQTVAAVIALALRFRRPVHIAHVSTRDEVLMVRMAKDEGWPVTCEVCPHHLFLTKDDSNLNEKTRNVRPPLGTQDDVDALWENMNIIDCFATDHAPHTWTEKNSEKSPPGFPGLETMLPLLLTAVHEGRLTIDDLVLRLHENPKRIFRLPDQPNTYVEIDMDESWVLPKIPKHSKAGWSPFAGRRVFGMVRRVVLRNEEACVDGKVLARKGFGINVRQNYTPPSVVTGALLPPLPALDIGGTGQSLSSMHPPKSPMPSVSKRFMMHDEYQTCMNEIPLKRRNRHESVSAVTIRKLRNIFNGKDVLKIEDFGKPSLTELFDVATTLRQCVIENKLLEVSKGGQIDVMPVCDLLKGKVLASVFYEVSTRTSCSFTAAMQRLGGSVVFMDSQTSSVQKGETLEDTIRVMSSYADIVVLRHPEAGAASRAADVSLKPIINAGDGIGQHPTQAMLDLLTIREELGTLNGLTITVVGDLKHGRTVHSLLRALCMYDVSFKCVSPNSLCLPQELVTFISKQNKTLERCDTLEQAIRENTDVLYMTRIQKERFLTDADYESCKGQFILTSQLMAHAKQNMIVLHPLPRVDEISPEVDCDSRAAYFRQAEHGVYVRMALLVMVLGRI